MQEIIPDLLVTVMSHRGLTAPTSISVWKLKTIRNFYVEFGIFAGDALLSRGRCQACTKFLDTTKIPYMLFVDDDIVFEPQDIEKIYNHLKSGYDVVGGLYPVRGASQLSSYGWGGHLEVDGNVHEIEYLATGFMGISRRILEKVRSELELPLLNPNDWSTCYPFFEPGRKTDRPEGDPIYISEDWDFCEKVRQIGG